LTENIIIQIQPFLASHTTLSLATINLDGGPQSAVLFYAETDELSLVFTSERKTQHSKNIARDNRVAGAIYADGQDWQSIQGIQFEGICSELSGADGREAKTIYITKYPFITKNKLLEIALSKAVFYRINPTWIRLVDNSRGFGYKREIHVNP